MRSVGPATVESRRVSILRVADESGKRAILALHVLPTPPMKRDSRAADGLNLALDPAAPLSLQHQLRQKLVDAIHRRVLRPGQRLPSSRQLAARLGVSRNTVSLAYDSLLAEGHLTSRSRSGIYVAADVPGMRTSRRTRGADLASPLLARLPVASEEGGFRCPQHWHRYPFPFVDGRVDAELAPVAEWSEAIRLAGSRHEVVEWPQQAGDADDTMLVEEMRGKVLPMRGVEAGADEVLITLSSRHALQVVGELLTRRGAQVLLEQPVDVALEHVLRERGAEIGYLSPGLDEPFAEGVVVFTSGRHGFAANSNYPRRLLAHVVAANGLLIEHDVPAGVQDGERVAPALRGFDRDGRVIYVGGLAPVASCGEAPGVLVAAPAFIERARALRRSQGCTPPRILQRAWAYYIGLGHYSASLVRAGRLLADRRTALRDALNHYLHDRVSIETFAGASAYWVSLRDGLDPWELARRAAAVGVLVEPIRTIDGSGTLCMGVTGIPADRIREGVRHLARLVRSGLAGSPGRIGDDGVAPLVARQLRKSLAGSTMLYSTVYGEPCTIEIRANGELIGTAGYSGEDCDQGHWWVEGDRWYRQWRQWAYGEAAGYAVTLDGDQVGLYGDDGVMVDTMVRVRSGRPKRRN